MIAVYGLRATELILIIALLLPAVINGWVLWMVFKGRKRNRKVRKYPVLPEQSSQLAKLYRKAGAKAELVFIEQAHHAFWNYNPWFKMKRWNAPPRFFLHVHISTYREW
jgi:hypothetical protein